MSRTGCRGIAVPLVLVALVVGCGSGSPVDTTVASIGFATQALPAAGAGELYNSVIFFNTEGGAALPDRFSIRTGVLPPGVRLIRDTADNDGDGLPDPDGAFTGHARVIGFPRDTGSFAFSIQAVSTGLLGGLAQNSSQPDLSTSAEFVINVGEGAVKILTPTAAEGTLDPALPAFPETITFVNPENPQAFFSFSFFVAGGTSNRLLNLYIPRELELSQFDGPVTNGTVPVSFDLDEEPTTGDRFENDFGDGGWFVLQAGNEKVQFGGFQSPRGPVGTLTEHAGGAGLDPVWFQRLPQDGGPAQNSRRTFSGLAGNLPGPGGDATLGTPLPVQFSDWFDPQFEGTHPSFTPPVGSGLQRRKYPFTMDQYQNAFFLPFNNNIHVTPLRFRAIAEAIDTRGTADKSDDVIDRKAYIVQVTIPDIVIDTVVLANGQAGVDYNEFVNASGGVPPLSFDLEFVDNTPDLAITDGDPLDKQLFGLEIDPRTGQFFGVPRASDTNGNIEISIRVFAEVMNPLTQDTSDFIPFPGGESNGEHPVTGKRGAHKTIPVVYDAPEFPFVVNSGLVPGDDGLPYPGDTLVGGGGVPLLVPYPVGFTANTYPSGSVARNYSWRTSFPLDDSHANVGTVVQGLPNGMAFDGEATSATNGSLTGTPTDRGFHPVSFQGTDFFAGPATTAHPTNNQTPFVKVLTLSISPDSAIYMRGKLATEGPGTPSGIVDFATAASEARMTPLFQDAGIFKTDTGVTPQLVNSEVPGTLDVIPVLLANGGSKSHVDKSIPSITGFWPAESGSEFEWEVNAHGAWRHLQQEFVWLQTNNASHARVFLLGETRIKNFAGAASNPVPDSKRYQQYVDDGKRLVMVADPLEGEAWFPAILENDNPNHGLSFGSEYVQVRGNENRLEADAGVGYFTNRDHAQNDSRGAREMHTQGLGSFLEPHQQTNNFVGANTQQGRGASSVAMSHDGIWCATGLFGGDQAKFLIWRTDRQPLPDTLLAADNVEALDGQDLNGNVLANTAAIVQLGGEDKDLAADSLMFVPNGILFLQTNQLSTIFGLSLVDGSLTQKSVNTRSTVNAAGIGPQANADTGMFIPDRDHLKGPIQKPQFLVQFAWAGNEPAADAMGPDKIVFVAGANAYKREFTDLPGTRSGWQMAANRRKSLLFLEVADTANGFDASASTITDLSGSDPEIQGDFLSPGAPGDSADWLVLSRSGDYAAVVREGTNEEETLNNFALRVPTFASAETASNNPNFNGWVGNHDILIISTNGDDLDTGSGGTQHVLYLGTGDDGFQASAPNPPSMPSYATGRNYFNARYRRMQGLEFSADEQFVYFQYAGHQNNTPQYFGFDDGWGPNADSAYGNNFGTVGTEIIARVRFMGDDGSAIDFDAAEITNGLDDLDGASGVGDTSADFGATGSQNIMWARFRSENGNFLYYIVDGVTPGPDRNDRNYIVGYNTSGNTINGHEPHVPFSPHAPEVAFEQFDYGAWNFESRFAASPGNVALNGFDAKGIVCIIGNDATSPDSPTDLEVYAFNANRGTDLVALTSAVTDGDANAINHLYLSADGNTLIGQRSSTTASSRTSRAELNGNNDLFCVNNLHAVVFGGADPNAFVVSAGRSHGASVALVGEGTSGGAQSVVYSASDQTGGNETWDDRTLRVAPLQPNGGDFAAIMDSARSHYAVIVGGRKIDDDPDTED